MTLHSQGHEPDDMIVPLLESTSGLFSINVVA